MFAVEERDRVRERLLELARADPAIAGAALTGSFAVGQSDRWSDIDLAFAVRGELDAALARWTGVLYGEFGAVHHWDLASGSAVYRVFLLLELLPGPGRAGAAGSLARTGGPCGLRSRMASWAGERFRR